MYVFGEVEIIVEVSVNKYEKEVFFVREYFCERILRRYRY